MPLCEFIVNLQGQPSFFDLTPIDVANYVSTVWGHPELKVSLIYDEISFFLLYNNSWKNVRWWQCEIALRDYIWQLTGWKIFQQFLPIYVAGNSWSVWLDVFSVSLLQSAKVLVSDFKILWRNWLKQLFPLWILGSYGGRAVYAFSLPLW